MADLVLDWGALGPYGTALDDTAPDAVTTSVDTGGVAVDITFDGQDAGAQAFTFNASGYVAPDETFNPSSHLKLFGEGGDGGGVSPTSQAILDFRATDTTLYTDNVQNVSFRLNDVDNGTEGDLFGPGTGFEDNVTVLAFDDAGNAVPVTLTAAGGAGVSGASTTGSSTTDFTDPDGSVLVEITGPVSRIEVVYGNGGDSAQGVLISDVEFSTVDVGVEDLPPVAVDDSATTPEGVPVDISVLDNDSDPEGGALTVTGATVDTGTVVVNADNTVTYTPPADYDGPATITYTIEDPAGNSATGEVAVTVTDDNLPPVAVDDPVSTPEDTEIVIDPASNDSDPDGDPLTVTGITPPTNGTATLNGDGTVTYLPDPGYIGEDTITYTVDDGNGGTDTADIIVTVTDGNSPPVAVDDSATTTPDTSVVIDLTGNDSDPDGDPLTVTFVSDPANGSVVDNGDGTVTYTPDAGYTGTDTFDYDVNDPSGDSDTADVTVTIADGNSPPDADPDAATTDVGVPTTIFVQGNDSDPDGDPLTTVSATDPANGSTTVNPDGSVTYTPDAGFVGDDTFEYTIEDPSGATATETVTVTVADPNAPPVAVDDPITTPEDTAVTLDPASNDTDPDGDTLTTTAVGTPTSGTATLNPDGTVTFTPDPGFTGEVTIPYTVSDGNGGTDTADIVVTVGGGGGDDGRIDTDVFPVDPADQGRDPLDGLDEDDDPSDDLDSVTGTSGADVISTGDDDDTIVAGAGDDTVTPGIDDDLVDLGGGDDSLVDIQGSDTISGGQGDDTINAGTNTFSDYEGDDAAFGAGTLLNDLGFTADPNQEDGRDSIQGNLGNDLIFTGDDRDTIDGGGDNDTIDAGIDDDTVMGGQGDDSIIGSHGSDSLDGGQGNDYIDGSNLSVLELTDDIDVNTENDRDSINGALGDDTLIGGDDDDTLIGGSGEDLLDGGIDEDDLSGGNDDDTLLGGAGGDTLDGGAGADDIQGGADRDVIVINSAAEGTDDTITGNAEGDDFDQLDLTGVGVRGEDWRIVDTSVDSNGNGIDGTVEYLNAAGEVTGTTDFFEIEEVVPCFTPGTLIATPQGERLVEELQEGDRIITRDNGIQEIKWVGRKDLTGFDLARKPHFKPILIQKGALGANLPEHDMLVSPNHRVLVANDKTALYFEEREVLVAAKHLTGLDGVDEVEANGVAYIHVMFENHEVILSNGAWTESFQPGDYTLKGIGNAQRQEIFELFPELEQAEGLKAYGSARRSLKKHEAALLTK